MDLLLFGEVGDVEFLEQIVEDEAVEILRNVRRLAEVLLRMGSENQTRT